MATAGASSGQTSSTAQGAWSTTKRVGGPSDLGFNTFAGNNIAALQAQFAEVFLDVATHDTGFRGECRSVIDLGTNNEVTCSHKSEHADAAAKPSTAAESRVPLALAAEQALRNAFPARP